jgi:thiol-disulfide isomerase/thioredoxin
MRVGVLIVAILLGFLGLFFTETFIGAIIGLPMLFIGFILFFYGLFAKPEGSRPSRQSEGVGSRRFCISCGAGLHDESEFCHKCGAKQPEQVEHVEYVPAKSVKVQRSVSEVKRYGLTKTEMIAIPIIIMIAVWAAYSYTQSYPTSSNLSTYTSASFSSANAPDFTLPIVNSNGPTGQSATLSSFSGKVVLLEFMEPWSPHCQRMALILDTLYAQYGANVVFISIAGPWNGATASDTANFISTYGTNWMFVYDSSGIVFSNYGVQSTPTFFIIGKDGSVSSTFQGEQTTNTLAAALSAAS